MRLFITLALVLMVACGTPAGVDAGTSTGGGTPTGGGSSTGGGSAIGGGSATGGGTATGGGSTTGGGTASGGGGGATGMDGGMGDAGAGQACANASACGAADDGGAWCTQRNLSCLGGLCLPECRPARTCNINVDAGCITCGSTTTCSTFDGCIGGVGGNGHIERASCAQWPDGGAFEGSAITVINAGCTANFGRRDAGTEGRITVLDDFTKIGVLPGFGGGCTVTDLALGDGPQYLRRWGVTCARCEFIVVFDGT